MGPFNFDLDITIPKIKKIEGGPEAFPVFDFIRKEDGGHLFVCNTVGLLEMKAIIDEAIAGAACRIGEPTDGMPVKVLTPRYVRNDPDSPWDQKKFFLGVAIVDPESIGPEVERRQKHQARIVAES